MISDQALIQHVESYLHKSAGLGSVTQLTKTSSNQLSIFSSAGAVDHPAFISTVGLCTFDLPINTPRPIRTELIFIPPDQNSLWRRMLIDISLRIIHDPTLATSNQIFDNVLPLNLPHILLANSFHDSVRSLQMDDVKVAWLQPITISQGELEFAGRQDGGILYAYIKAAGADVADPYRKAIDIPKRTFTP